MSLDLTALSRMSYGNGMTFWGYRTKDEPKDLQSPSYWRGAITLLDVGDFIFTCHIGAGSAIYCIGPVGQVRRLAAWPQEPADTVARLHEKVDELTTLVEKMQRQLQAEGLVT